MSARGLTAKGVPPQPRWLLYLKIAILVLSLVVLALAAYSISLFGSYYGIVGGTGAGGFLIFVVGFPFLLFPLSLPVSNSLTRGVQTLKTFIIIGGATVIEVWFPHLFYRIVALVVYNLSIIFWLSAWAWAASTAALWLGSSCYLGTCSSPSSYASREGGALAACAGLGAIIW